MAACTSRAAPSMSRLRSNCSVMRAWPMPLCEVISVTSAIVPRWRSSGLATLVATVSGLAPGSWALTEMVGKSTCGSGATGSFENASTPASAMPSVSSVVATGREMKGAEIFIRRGSPPPTGLRRPASGEAHRQPVEVEIDHRRGEQRQHLADDQAADDGEAERLAQLGAGALAQHQRQRAEDRRHGGHHDRPEAQQARLVDGVARRQAFDALGFQREVDHHDGVLLDDADQQDDADDGDDVEVVAEQHQRQQRADAGRRQGREDRDRVDEALVEHAEHDIHRRPRRRGSGTPRCSATTGTPRRCLGTR